MSITISEPSYTSKNIYHSINPDGVEEIGEEVGHIL